jgi:hypothetical protein
VGVLVWEFVLDARCFVDSTTHVKLLPFQSPRDATVQRHASVQW